MAAEESKALNYFETSSLEEAGTLARQFLATVRDCGRCRRVLSQLHQRLGSTLFRDDDPQTLAGAFDARDRQGCTHLLLAACIILFGRRRVALGVAPPDSLAPLVTLPVLIWIRDDGVTVTCPAIPGSSAHSSTRAAALRELRRIVWRRVDRGERLIAPRVVFEPFELPSQ